MAQLPDETVQQLLEDIESRGRVYAKAKAFAKAMEEARKITKNTLMKLARLQGAARSRDAAESEAYTDPQYKLASDKLIQAIEDEVNAQTTYENAVRECEAWRTICANERNIR